MQQTAQDTFRSWRSQSSGLSAESKATRVCEPHGVSRCRGCTTSASSLSKRLSRFDSSKSPKRATSLPASFAHNKAKEGPSSSPAGRCGRPAKSTCQVTAPALSAKSPPSRPALRGTRSRVLPQSIWSYSPTLGRRSIFTNWNAKVSCRRTLTRRFYRRATNRLGQWRKEKIADTLPRIPVGLDRAEDREDGRTVSSGGAATRLPELIQQGSKKPTKQLPAAPDVPTLVAQPRRLTSPYASLFQRDGEFSSPVSAGIQAILPAGATDNTYRTVSCVAGEVRSSTPCSGTCAVSDSSSAREPLTRASVLSSSDTMRSFIFSPSASLCRGANNSPEDSSFRSLSRRKQFSSLHGALVSKRQSCAAALPRCPFQTPPHARASLATSDEERNAFSEKGCRPSRAILRQNHWPPSRTVPWPPGGHGPTRLKALWVCGNRERRLSDESCGCGRVQSGKEAHIRHSRPPDSVDVRIRQCGALSRRRTVPPFRSGREAGLPMKLWARTERRWSDPGHAWNRVPLGSLKRAQEATACSVSPSPQSSNSTAGEAKRLEAFMLVRRQKAYATCALNGETGQGRGGRVDIGGTLPQLPPSSWYSPTAVASTRPRDPSISSNDPVCSPCSKGGASTSSSLTFNTQGALLACIDLLEKSADFQSADTPSGPPRVRRRQGRLDAALCNWESSSSSRRAEVRAVDATPGSRMSTRLSSPLSDSRKETDLRGGSPVPRNLGGAAMNPAEGPWPASMTPTALSAPRVPRPHRPAARSSTGLQPVDSLPSPGRPQPRDLSTPSPQDWSSTKVSLGSYRSCRTSKPTFPGNEGTRTVRSRLRSDADGRQRVAGRGARDKPQWMTVRHFPVLPRTEEERAVEGEEYDGSHTGEGAKTEGADRLETHTAPGVSEVSTPPTERRGAPVVWSRPSEHLEQTSSRTAVEKYTQKHFHKQKSLATGVHHQLSGAFAVQQRKRHLSESSPSNLAQDDPGPRRTLAALAVGSASERVFRNQTVEREGRRAYGNSFSHSRRTPFTISHTMADVVETNSSLPSHRLLRQAASSVPRLPVVGHELKSRAYYKALLTRTRTADPAVVQAAAALALVEVAAETTGSDMPTNPWGDSIIRGALAKLGIENNTSNVNTAAQVGQRLCVEPECGTSARKKMLFKRLQETFSGIPDSWHERSCRILTGNTPGERGVRQEPSNLCTAKGTSRDIVHPSNSGAPQASGARPPGKDRTTATLRAVMWNACVFPLACRGQCPSSHLWHR